MKPSQVVSKLHQIATAIENSKKPDRRLVAKDLKQILVVLAAEYPQKLYRIITDAPMGVAVSFKPSQESLNALGATMDEWDLVGDDGSDGEVLFAGDTTQDRVMIREKYPTQEELDADIIPLGPDLNIFRSQQEFDDYITEYNK